MLNRVLMDLMILALLFLTPALCATIEKADFRGVKTLVENAAVIITIPIDAPADVIHDLALWGTGY